jgi:hypothetical protein
MGIKYLDNQSSGRIRYLDNKDEQYTYGDAFKDTAKTVGKSAVEDVIKPAYDFATNFSPEKTALGVAKAGVRVASHPIKSLKAAFQHAVDNYGPQDVYDERTGTNVPAYAKTISTRPFKFVSDAAALAGAGTVVKPSLLKGASLKNYPTTGNVAKATARGAVNTASGVGKAVKTAGTSTAEFFNFEKRALTLGQKVRSVAASAKQAATDKFGVSQEMIQNAGQGKAVSLRGVVDDINANLQEMAPEARNVFRRTPVLKDLLNKPELADNVTLTKTQEILNYINSKVPSSIKYNHLDIMDTLHDIKASQLDAFPEMAGVKADYGKFANDYKLLKSALSPKNTPNAILNNFNNNIAVKDAATRILQPVLKDMGKLRGQVAVTNFIKRLVSLGVAGKVGKYIIPR